MKRVAEKPIGQPVWLSSSSEKRIITLSTPGSRLIPRGSRRNSPQPGEREPVKLEAW